MKALSSGLVKGIVMLLFSLSMLILHVQASIVVVYIQRGVKHKIYAS